MTHAIFRRRSARPGSHRRAKSQLSYDRQRLTLEPLESRCLLTTITVDTLMDELDGSIDDGDISLRDAIAYSNANAGGDTITFEAALDGGTILMDIGLGDLPISGSLVIDAGNLTSGLTIDANDPTPFTLDGDGIRVFRIQDNTVNLMDVQLLGLTLTGGDTPGAGGAIRSEERLTIVDSKITGNKAASTGGGVAGIGPTWIGHSTISGNATYAGGGGVAVVAETTVHNSTISGNWSFYRGGGLHVAGTIGASLMLTSSTVSANAAAHEGGGIWAGNYSVTTVNSSTISGNVSAASGGGIYSYLNQGTLDIRYTTIADNVADFYDSGAGTGGGLSAQGSRNPRMRHTLVGNNLGSHGSADDVAGQMIANHCLIESNRSGASIVGFNNILNEDPILGLLADNGGPTQTHALLPGSPAINAGDFYFNPPPEFDQRGAPFIRDFKRRIDIGSFESQPFEVDADFNDDGSYDHQDMDALVAEIAAGTHGLALDLTGDGRVDLADRDDWLTRAGEINLGPGKEYLLGDANLDGLVDGRDFNVWNGHKFTTVAAWSSGDFNADGHVDGSDFGIWNINKFQISDGRDRLLEDEQELQDDWRILFIP